MPSTGPRVNAVLERPLYSAVRALARRHGMSMSEMVRRRPVNPAPSIPHEEVRRRFGGR